MILFLMKLKMYKDFSKINNTKESVNKIKNLINIFKERSNTLNELIDNLNLINNEVFSYSKIEKKMLNNL